MLIVATDGSCYPNPGPGGWAWVDEHGNYKAGSFSEGTNNVGELSAILMAMMDHPKDDLEIQYDSKYAMRCITEFGPNWKKIGTFHTRKNHQLIDQAMIQLQLREERGLITIWTHTRGHQGHLLNEAADTLAGRMKPKPDGYTEEGVFPLS